MPKNPRNIRMQDVADHIGISVSTVSRSLSRPDMVSAKVKTLIDNAVEELGYRRLRQSAALKGINNGMTGHDMEIGKVGLLMPKSICQAVAAPNGVHHWDPLFTSVLKEVEDAGGRLALMACDRHGQENTPSIIEREQVSGLLIGFSPSEHDLHWLETLAKRLPVVALNTIIPHPPIPSIAVDNRLMMYKAVGRLRELGHSRIAFFGVGENYPNLDLYEHFHALERRHYYTEALRFNGLAIDPELCKAETFALGEHAPAIEATMQRMMSLPEPPTAIISSLGTMPCFFDVIARMKLRAPNDLSLLATDEASLAEMMPCPLTTIGSNHPQGAHLAVELLIKMIRNHRQLSNNVQYIRFEPLLTERASLAPPRQ
ncbi:MAG: LacI family DNA-binding transcriptional regulator [Verrucomicrobiota bacterium]